MPKIPRKYVPAWKIQELFNRGNYWRRMQQGEFTAVLKKDVLAPRKSWLPSGTRSQLVAYYNSAGTKIAIVHQYLKPDGTLGASGRPDPKLLLHRKVLYFIRRS